MPSPSPTPIVIATRGSALALAQANAVLRDCRRAFPRKSFEIRVYKTTGDTLQSQAPESVGGDATPKGLFTKELEAALLRQEAHLAVHSLKDLPTDLPEGLVLGAVGRRADVRDVLIFRDRDALAARPPAGTESDWAPGSPRFRGFPPATGLADLPPGTVVATNSTRRQAQLLAVRPDFRVEPIRGNVPTRLRKLAEQPAWDALVLAAAGLERLRFRIFPDGSLRGEGVPAGLRAVFLDPERFLPCVGQAAVGIEVRREDSAAAEICARLNHAATYACVKAERSFLRTLGGGCQSPVGALAAVRGHELLLRGMVFRDERCLRVEGRTTLREGEALGEALARQIVDGAAEINP